MLNQENPPFTEGPPTARFDIAGCARCGCDHEGVPFFPFTRPVVGDGGELQATHWGVCIETAEPLLLLIKEDESPSSEAVSHAAEGGPAT